MLPRLISGIVRGLEASFPFIVVAGGWPSALLAILSLGLPLVGAYFPPRFHRYFKPKGGVTSWFTPSELNTTRLPAGVGLLVSGSERFIDGIMGTVGPTRRIIALVEISLRGATLRVLRKSRASAKELLTRHGMQPVSFLDSENGGATDACHVLGFGQDLGSDGLPTASKGLLLSQGCFPADIKGAVLVCVGGRRPATVGVVAPGHGAGGGALPVHPPTFFGVLPFPFLSRTVD